MTEGGFTALETEPGVGKGTLLFCKLEIQDRPSNVFNSSKDVYSGILEKTHEGQ